MLLHLYEGLICKDALLRDRKIKTQHLSGSTPTISWLQGVCSTGVLQPLFKENNVFFGTSLVAQITLLHKKSGENFTSHSATKNSSVEIGRETKFFWTILAANNYN